MTKDKSELNLRDKAKHLKYNYEYKKSLNLYNLLVFFNRKDYYIYINRAELCDEMHKYKEAIQDYRKAVKIAEEDGYIMQHASYAHSQIAKIYCKNSVRM